MPFVFGLIILLTLRSVVFGEMSNMVDLFTVYSLLRRLLDRLVLVPALDYGHNLDPHAPMTSSRSPRVIGVKANRELPRAQFP